MDVSLTLANLVCIHFLVMNPATGSDKTLERKRDRELETLCRGGRLSGVKV